jgi:hypothetical protein
MLAYFHACPDAECHCFDAIKYAVAHADGCSFRYTHADVRANAKPYRDAIAHRDGHPDEQPKRRPLLR